MACKNRKISKISLLHYVKLVVRSLLFIGALVVYIINKVNHSEDLFLGIEDKPIILGIIWILFVAEMILRFFPVKLESMGCQKQFAKNYLPGEENVPKKQKALSTFAVAAFWLALNGIIGLLYFLGVYDAGVLVLISLAFSVCDMICILFFCPFQTWVMKNKCCTTCRIYNWDYAMMFTPLIFIKNPFTLSIVAIALLLLVKWEYLYHKHPERFTENTNRSLACSNCKEKLCFHKRQLRSFLKKQKELLKQQTEKVKTKLQSGKNKSDKND